MPVPKYSKWNITAASLGTEEMAHFEMVATIVHQLTRNLTPEEIKESGFGEYYIDHTLGVWPQAAGGVPQNACEFQVKGDPITDIVEDMAVKLAVLSFSVKPEVGSFEGVWVCVLVIVFCVFIYCNLPDLLHQTSGSAQFPLHAGSGSGQ